MDDRTAKNRTYPGDGGIPSYQKGTAIILIGMIVVFISEGALLGYLIQIFFPEDVRWTYGAAAGFLVAVTIAAYCWFHKVDIGRFGDSHQRATEYNAPELYSIVEELSAKAGIKTPRVFIMKDDFPNAFALANSPDDSMVGITTAGLELWNHDELEGIMGHELSHILHRDTLVNQTARTCAKVLTASAAVMGVVSLISAVFLGASASASGSSKNNEGAGLVFLIVAAVTIPIIIVGAVLYFMVPPASAALRFGVSRSREYGADESSAVLTGKPMALASALIKADSMCLNHSDYKDVASENLWVVNPLGSSKRKKLTARLLSTHPSTEDRVKRLDKLNQEIKGPTIYRYIDV